MRRRRSAPRSLGTTPFASFLGSRPLLFQEGSPPCLQESLQAFIEGRRLDAQCPEIDVSLTAMMDLVVDRVEQEVVDLSGILPKGGLGLLEAIRGNLRPELVERFGGFIPTG